MPCFTYQSRSLQSLSLLFKTPIRNKAIAYFSSSFFFCQWNYDFHVTAFEKSQFLFQVPRDFIVHMLRLCVNGAPDCVSAYPPCKFC